MSIRSSSSVPVVDGLSNNMFGSAPAGFAAGDRLIFVISQDLASSVFTPPGGEGWASIGRADNTIDGQSLEVFEIKSASGSETFQFTSSTQKRAIIQVYAFTGRHETDAAVVSTPTISNASNATPISVALTGLTASAGSDVLWIASLDQLDGADIWSFSGLSGYTVEQNVANGDWITLSGWVKESVSSGATGTLTATATRTSGSSTAGFAGIVIALPSGGSPTSYYLSDTVEM